MKKGSKLLLTFIFIKFLFFVIVAKSFFCITISSSFNVWQKRVSIEWRRSDVVRKRRNKKLYITLMRIKTISDEYICSCTDPRFGVILLSI